MTHTHSSILLINDINIELNNEPTVVVVIMRWISWKRMNEFRIRIVCCVYAATIDPFYFFSFFCTCNILFHLNCLKQKLIIIILGLKKKKNLIQYSHHHHHHQWTTSYLGYPTPVIIMWQTKPSFCCFFFVSFCISFHFDFDSVFVIFFFVCLLCVSFWDWE